MNAWYTQVEAWLRSPCCQRKRSHLLQDEMEDPDHLNPVWVYEINWILIYSLIKVLSASGLRRARHWTGCLCGPY